MPDAVSAMAKDILAHHVLSPVGGVCSVCAQYVLGACQPCTSAYSYLWYGHIRAYGHETITAPTPSLQHHCTLTARSHTNTAASLHHHYTIIAQSRHHP